MLIIVNVYVKHVTLEFLINRGVRINGWEGAFLKISFPGGLYNVCIRGYLISGWEGAKSLKF